jgi:LuxR family maltose regulon positive regulatory protein
MNTLITQTKIIVPSLRPDLLSRQRLTDLLYDSLVDNKITIIAAPAGYGKTSVAVDLAHQTDMPVCWYALDTTDRSLPRFVSHLIASIAYRFPEFGKQSTAAIRNAEQSNFDLDILITVIVNELYECVREHFALVLDDYHLVDRFQEIGDFTNRFAQAVGENCHLLILSRTLLTLTELPLMVSRSQVGGLDYNELAFQPKEIQALILQNYHLSLPDSEAKSLEEETEGWITGLLLSAQTMWQGMSDRARTARVSGVGLYDYLAQQVLEQQLPDIRDFLMRTSFLEEFDAELCQEVFGDGKDWNNLIRRVLRENLFILPVGDRGNWVRYHHLFRDFLQAQLAQERPDEPAHILRQLASVFTRREDWERSYEIYQRLGDLEAVASLIEQARAPLMRGGRWRTLAEWLDALPDHTLAQRPGLISARGIVAVMLGEIERGLALLDQAEEALRAAGNKHELAYTLERRAYAHFFSGAYQAALSDADQALALAGQEKDLSVVRAEALKVKAQCWKHLGQLDATLDALQTAKSIFLELDYQDDLSIVNIRLGAVYHEIGAYGLANSAYQTAIDHFRKAGNIVNLALNLNNAGVTQHAIGDYQRASRYFEDALIYAQRSGYKYAEACALSSIGDVYADLDAPDAGRQAYQEARQVAERIQNRFLLIYLDLAEAILACSNGELSLARALLQSARAITKESNSAYERALCQLGAGRLALSENDTAQAQASLEKAVQHFEDGSQRVEVARTRIYLAMAFYTAGDLNAALKQLELAFQSASELENQHILVVAGREVKSLLEAAQRYPIIGLQATHLLEQITRFEADIPSLRRGLRKQILTVPFAPPHLTIQAFGEGQVLLNGQPATSPDWVSRKPVRELLFCLLAHPRGLTKEEIGLIFWPESSPAQLKLRYKNIIYWLRHALGQDVILFDSNYYLFNRSLDYEYDVDAFKHKLDLAQSAGNPSDQITAYQSAMELYQGQYLPSTDQNWAALEREQLRQAYLDAGINLGNLLLDARDYQGTLETCRRLLLEDSCLEVAHRLAMRAHAALGDRASVARQYESCRASLLEEIDVQPSEDTRNLYEILIR